ncbi:GIY-YIG nuclease family protein [Clostridium botulinum]|uniref:GIY-YIG nuclease family protein n=1 Tax=Clostridium botulinum TaxID=1491 RepID=UPI001C9B2AA1|nr:GIY-YIG nuclease family protein [Clostridium botulinum]MBY6838646.1 GIY-YIG nuclease family protein [Clostridium botulinum]
MRQEQEELTNTLRKRAYGALKEHSREYRAKTANIVSKGGDYIIIYKITCLINNKVYIGQTSESIKQRFSRHMGYQKDEHDTKFYRAVRKYGRENFCIEQIDSAQTQEELDEKEVNWIKHYNSYQRGYNSKISKGKCGGDTLSNHKNKKEILKKISESKIGDKNPMRNPINSKKISGKNNGMAGRFGKENPWSKEIVVLDENLNFIEKYDSLSDVKRIYEVTTVSMITLRCQGKTKSPYKGYYFKYYDDYISSRV